MSLSSGRSRPRPRRPAVVHQDGLVAEGGLEEQQPVDISSLDDLFRPRGPFPILRVDERGAACKPFAGHGGAGPEVRWREEQRVAGDELEMRPHQQSFVPGGRRRGKAHHGLSIILSPHVKDCQLGDAAVAGRPCRVAERHRIVHGGTLRAHISWRGPPRSTPRPPEPPTETRSFPGSCSYLAPGARR